LRQKDHKFEAQPVLHREFKANLGQKKKKKKKGERAGERKKIIHLLEMSASESALPSLILV
jgi:hypothetical protein